MVQIPEIQRLALGRRQLFGGASNNDDGGGLLGGLFGGGDDDKDTTTVQPITTGATVGNTRTNTATNTGTTTSAPSATGTNASRPPTISSVTPASSSSAVSSVAPSTSSSVPTTSAPPVTSTYESTANGQVITVTATVSTPPANAAAASSAAASSTDTPVPAKGFLQNKPLAGAVFGVIGLIGLIAFLALITLSVRRSRRKKLTDEAVSFDPSGVTHSPDDFQRPSSTDKTGFYSNSESGHGHGGGYTGGYGQPMSAQPMSAASFGATYDQAYGGYAPGPGYGQTQQQQFGNQYNSPMQLPSANVSSEQNRIPRVAPPAIPQVAVNGQFDGASQPYSPAHSSPPAPPGIPSKRASDSGSLTDNSYVGGAHEYKVANV